MSQKYKKPINYIEMGAGLIALTGILVFGIPSPETRPKIYELYLAGVWLMMTISTVSSYCHWQKSHWSRKVLSITAPLFVILYLLKYFMGV